MEWLKILTSNYLLNVAFVAWWAAQVLKTLFSFLLTNRFNIERLFGSGGMPSSHSALVCSLAVGMARKMGFSSPEFAITVVLAAIVMYDAMGVRRAAGEQAKVINKMLFTLPNLSEEDDGEEPQDEKPIGNEPKENEPNSIFPNQFANKALKEFLGHTPLEVLGGALLGILIAMLMPIR